MHRRDGNRAILDERFDSRLGYGEPLINQLRFRYRVDSEELPRTASSALEKTVLKQPDTHATSKKEAEPKLRFGYQAVRASTTWKP